MTVPLALNDTSEVVECKWRPARFGGLPSALLSECSFCGRQWTTSWLHKVHPLECPARKQIREEQESRKR